VHFLHLKRPGFSLFSDLPFKQLIGFSLTGNRALETRN
jgi:hypothetical protein